MPNNRVGHLSIWPPNENNNLGPALPNDLCHNGYKTFPNLPTNIFLYDAWTVSYIRHNDDTKLPVEGYLDAK